MRLFRRAARQPDVPGFLLADVADEPQVARELAAAPPVWHSCVGSPHPEGTGDAEEPDLALDELLEYVEVGADHGEWSFSVDDAVKLVVDTGLEEDDDPVIAVLRSDPRVTEAFHPDREWFAWRVERPLSRGHAAALVLRALVAGHRAALGDAAHPGE